MDFFWLLLLDMFVSSSCRFERKQNEIQSHICNKLQLQNSDSLLPTVVLSVCLCVCVSDMCVAQMSSLSRCIMSFLINTETEQPVAFHWLITAGTHHIWLLYFSVSHGEITSQYSVVYRFLCAKTKTTWNISKNFFFLRLVSHLLKLTTP